MRRRDILLQAAVLPALAALRGIAHAEDAAAFDGSTVRNMARDLAQQPYKAPDATLPPELKELDYQQYMASGSRDHTTLVSDHVV